MHVEEKYWAHMLSTFISWSLQTADEYNNHCTYLQIIQQWHHIYINTREIMIRCAEVGQTYLSNQSLLMSQCDKVLTNL